MTSDGRPSGIVVHDADPIEVGRALRGRSSSRTRNDALVAHQVDEAGCSDTFGLSRSATIDVPAEGGPTALLVQDLDTGRWRWQLGDVVRDDRATPVCRFRVETAEPDVPDADSDERSQTRGAIGAAAKVLVKVLGSAGGSRVVGRASAALVHSWEHVHRPSAMRWHSTRLGPNDEPRTEDLGGRSLLLLHDLFGTTASSFGRGTDATQWPSRYAGRVWGFDHPTISQSPAANADRLLEMLGPIGPDLTIDIVAHGRGGLVAAALAAHPLRRFDLGTVVLAGVPITGTPLCDADHLLALANRWTNLLSLVPDNLVTTTFDAVIALVSQLAHDAMAGLDGLTAMATGISGEPLRDVGRLRYLAAKFEPSGAFGARLADRALDALLGPANDLLVSVASASGTDGGDAQVVAAHHRNLLDGPGRAIVTAWLDASTATTVRMVAPGLASGASRAPRSFAVVARDAPDPRRPTVIGVEVQHGGVENAAGLTIVGHYLGTELTGTEAALDMRLRGKLAARQLARQYPERERDWLFIDRGPRERPAGVLVVGLGEPGTLTRSSLASTVSNGLVQHAFSLAEAGAASVVISLSAALIGTAEGAAVSLPIETSVAAIVEAVLAANQSLAELVDHAGRTVSDVVRYDSLTFVELYADKAEVAARYVRDIDDLVDSHGRGTAVALHDHLMNGRGGRPARLATDDDPGWQRIVVSGDGAPDRAGTELTFTSIGGRALTNDATIRPNQAVVVELLGRAVDEWSARTAGLLFELLVPVDLRPQIGAADNLQLVVDRVSARYPWEALIAARGASEAALSRRGGLIRQFHATERTRSAAPRLTGRSALVIGNPPTGDPRLLPLWGAVTECERVTQELTSGGYRVTTVPGLDEDPASSASRILEALVFEPHRVLHIAAHGVVDADDPDRTGVVIGPGAFLRADDIAQRSVTPELVFLNCCDLGADPGLASNLARAFMDSGAHVVVAAGWAVDDEAARQFAVTLYRRLLSGSTFGAAVRSARVEAYRADPGSSTWAAYQCYGDPGFRLESPRRGSQPPRAMVSRLELVRSIQVIALKAGDAGQRGAEAHEVVRRRLLADLVDLASWVEPDTDRKRWLDAAVYAELGRAAGELGDLDRAITWYRRALAYNTALLPVKAIEQLGNFEIRHAQQLRRADPAADVDELVSASFRHLMGVLRFGHSVERRGLLGSHFKKRAAMSDGPARRQLLVHAAKQYGLASALAPDDAYTTLNHLQLAHLFGAPSGEADDVIARVVGTAADDDFWELTRVGDGALTKLVLGRSVSATAVSDAYKRAFDFRSTWRERSSSLEHLRDLIELTPGEPINDALVDIREDLLEWLRSELGQEE